MLFTGPSCWESLIMSLNSFSHAKSQCCWEPNSKGIALDFSHPLPAHLMVNLDPDRHRLYLGRCVDTRARLTSLFLINIRSKPTSIHTCLYESSLSADLLLHPFLQPPSRAGWPNARWQKPLQFIPNSQEHILALFSLHLGRCPKIQSIPNISSPMAPLEWIR